MYNSYTGEDIDEKYSYCYPSARYDKFHFMVLMDNLYRLFEGNYYEDNSDASGACDFGSNYSVKTNIR